MRLRNPGTSVTFDDLIRGTVTFDTSELGDFVIARAIDDPLYHFAVVVDDGDAEVSHILRAEEHISNTPRQILIQEALEFPRPFYAHLPLILAPDRSKLSKRKHGASVDNYRNQGILADALINYLALLGWNPGTEQEFFSRVELIQLFDLDHVHRGGAVFDMEKLRWFNRHYLTAMRDDDFLDEALRRLEGAVGERGLIWDQNIAHKILPVVKERISAWGDIADEVSRGEFDFFFSKPTLDAAKIPEKRSNAEEARKHLQQVLNSLSGVEEFTQEAVKSAIWDYATVSGRGAVLWPFRYALSGKDRSPDPFVIASVIGKEETLERVRKATELLSI